MHINPNLKQPEDDIHIVKFVPKIAFCEYSGPHCGSGQNHFSVITSFNAYIKEHTSIKTQMSACRFSKKQLL